MNGVMIGGEGRLDKGFVGATKADRLCRIPRHLLNPEGENLIAVRVLSMRPNREEFPDHIRIGDYHTLFLEKTGNELWQTRIEVIFLIIMLMNFFIFVMNIIVGTLTKNLRYFGAYIFLTLVVYAGDSLLVYEMGWKTPLLQRIAFACMALLPATVLLVFYEKPTRWAKAFAGLMGAASLGLLVFFDGKLYPLLPYAGALIIAFFSIWILKMAWRDYVRNVPESGLILVNTLLAFLAAALFAVEAVVPVRPCRFYEEILIFFGPVYMYCRIFALIKLFNRFRQSQIELSKRILLTQERERERLSRELHDGIGQSLLALKLNLDMIQATAAESGSIKGGAIAALKADLSKVINEVRNIAAALRPSLFDRLNLSETIREDCGQLERNAGIRVVVKAVDLEEMPRETKHNAYRIYQEAMMNVIKHASATMVEVNLAVQGKSLHLQVIDNGKGFEEPQAAQDADGLGLSIMRERAELLGGTLVIKSAPGFGTSVLAEVPLP